MLRLACFAAVLAVALAAPSVPQAHSRYDHAVILLDNGQTKEQSGMTYFDLAGNRSRMDVDGQDLVIFSLYSLGKEFGVSSSGQCQYCPLDGGMLAFGPSDSATDLGPTVISGVNVEHYQENVTILGFLTMETDNWYIADGNVPVREFSILTPFGQYAGNATLDVTKFQPGAQPASLFQLPVDPSQCQESSQCGNGFGAAYARSRGLSAFSGMLQLVASVIH